MPIPRTPRSQNFHPWGTIMPSSIPFPTNSMPSGWRVDVYDEHRIVFNKIVGCNATQEQAKLKAIDNYKRNIKSLVLHINEQMSYLSTNKRILAKLETLELTEPELPLQAAREPDEPDDDTSEPVTGTASEPQLNEQSVSDWLNQQYQSRRSGVWETIRQHNVGTQTTPFIPDNMWW